ncbi:protein kinase [Arthrobacter sp. NPDC056727]|uniref:protein kinase domain-containing protein n=1 Tax=Arthrobacter sp. NPDC056727 TaxID=3345927 RepID=UPI00366C20DB
MDQHSLENHSFEHDSRGNHSAEKDDPEGEPPAVAGYSVCRRLGRGGNAEVWLVSQDPTGVKLALKCFGTPAGNDGPPGRESAPVAAREEDVRRELLVMSALDHEHLVKAYGVVRTGEPRDGSFGLLMDYAAGGSLQQLVTARGKLSVGETVTVLTPIAQVLGYLHGNGFTHSDVAPGNVLFSAHGKPLLADLGVARMVGDASGVPEQRTGGFTDPAPVDAVRAGLQPERDVYAAAALGWYCLTGQAPPPSAARPPLSLLVPEVPAELAAALEAGLSDDRRRRPSAAELGTAVYRSAAAVPVDLSRSVHDSVLPELLTRRPIPQPGGRVRNRLLAWGRRLKTVSWVRAAAGHGRRLSPGAGKAALVPSLPHAPAGHRGAGHAARHSSLRPTTGRPSPGPTSVEPPTHKPPPVRPSFARHRAERQSTGTLTADGRTADMRSADGRAKVITVASSLPPRVHRFAGADSGRHRFATAAGVLAAAVFGGAVFLGFPGAAQESGPQTQSSGPAAQGPALPGQQPSAAAQHDSLVPDDVRRRLAAKDPVEAVRGLAQLRSLALREGRLDLLDDVNAPNTPAHAADRAIRARLENLGTVLAGFSTSLSGLRRLPESTATRAVVAATSSATGYQERTADGGVVATGAPQQAVRLRLVLVPVEGSWRIADILPAG